MRSLRILVVLLLTALSASAQLGMRTRNPFYLYPRFGVIGNNPDMAAVLKQKHGMPDCGCSSSGRRKSESRASSLRFNSVAHPETKDASRSSARPASSFQVLA